MPAATKVPMSLSADLSGCQLVAARFAGVRFDHPHECDGFKEQNASDLNGASMIAAK
jgi:hypothetical protein